jgi:hypothetical protein
MQNQSVGPPLAQQGLGSGIKLSNSTLVDDQQSWKKYNDMVSIHLPPTTMDSFRILSNSEPTTESTCKFHAGDVFKLTVTELFEWISLFLKIAPPTQLVFDFLRVHSKLERRKVLLNKGDSIVFEAIKDTAWERFREIADLDPALTSAEILILPFGSAAFGSTSESMQQQLQQTHSANATSIILSDQPSSYLPGPNQNNSSFPPDSVRRRSTTEPAGPPPFRPPPQSHSSFPISPAPDTIDSHGGPSKTEPSRVPTPHVKTPQEGNIPNSNNNMMDAHAPPDPDPRRQPQHLPAQNPAPTRSARPRTDASTPSAAKIVVRVQIDGHGRLSRSYDKSALNTRTTNARFFAWFAQETGHAPAGTLRFDFKDALPAKSSVVAAGNEDHFDLMVHDIKRKFDRAKEFAPDMNEFCIVVTDPQWDSGDEDEDEDEDE